MSGVEIDGIDPRLPSVLQMQFMLSIFWPNLTEIRGCMLWSERFESDRFEEWWRRLDGDRGKIEATINHVHLYDCVLDDNIASGGKLLALERVARTIADVWRIHFAYLYPDKPVRISYASEPDEYGPTLSFRFH